MSVGSANTDENMVDDLFQDDDKGFVTSAAHIEAPMDVTVKHITKSAIYTLIWLRRHWA